MLDAIFLQKEKSGSFMFLQEKTATDFQNRWWYNTDFYPTFH